jgi:hypothetical protein
MVDNHVSTFATRSFLMPAHPRRPAKMDLTGDAPLRSKPAMQRIGAK